MKIYQQYHLILIEPSSVLIYSLPSAVLILPLIPFLPNVPITFIGKPVSIKNLLTGLLQVWGHDEIIEYMIQELEVWFPMKNKKR